MSGVLQRSGYFGTLFRVLFIYDHMYRTIFGIGHDIKDLLEVNKLPPLLISFFEMGNKVTSVDFCYIILEYPSPRLVCEMHS